MTCKACNYFFLLVKLPFYEFLLQAKKQGLDDAKGDKRSGILNHQVALLAYTQVKCKSNQCWPQPCSLPTDRSSMGRINTNLEHRSLPIGGSNEGDFGSLPAKG